MTNFKVPPDRPVCQVPPDGIVVLHPGVSARYDDCDFPSGTTFRFYYSEAPMDTDLPVTQPIPAEPKPLEVQPMEIQPAPEPMLDPAKLQAIGAENPMLALALAAIAVLGGGAAWKQWGKMSEQKHEQAMKQLELQASAQASVPTVQPPPCQAADAATQAKLAALEARMAKAEKASLSFEGGEDLDEKIEGMVKKALKAAAAKAKK
jgi:hypothetical protein